ncbi:hypothetical protein [Photobacterium ganghwense]|uniref:hypothetical protein n=1 Tax=Photobacterium ganghwense TaxID=320778 RepID=UPI001C2D8342|nr:hypothetical protein [Photobacterium ganghwense]MBV1839303.1 hypothetical protein [Photobacterium ganghwense]
MINPFKYFTKAESQTIAVWIQTLILGIGLFYAMVQIDFISSNYEIEMNTRYMKHHNQYRDEIYKKTESVYDFYANIKDENQLMRYL